MKAVDKVEKGKATTIQIVAPIGKPACITMREALRHKLKELGEELGMAVTTRSGSYNPTSFTVKVQFAVISDSGEAMGTEASNFQLFAEGEGLSRADLFKPFIHNNITYKLIGMTRRGKHTILGQREDGKVFKFLPREIRKILGHPESLGKAYFKPSEGN